MCFITAANPGSTRSGNVVITANAIQTSFTVVQAGSTYIQAPVPLTALVPGLPVPANFDGVAVDGAGNVFFSVPGNGQIGEWTPTNNRVRVLAEGMQQGVSFPCGLAVDSQDNVYFADPGTMSIGKWTAPNGPVSVLIPNLIATNLTIDAAGNLFFPGCIFPGEYPNFSLKEWSVASGLTTLISTGLDEPECVAVDVADNLYIGNRGNETISELLSGTASVDPNGTNTLISSGFKQIQDVAVDGSGNLAISDSSLLHVVERWQAVNGSLTPLVSRRRPGSVAVDAADNLYFIDIGYLAVEEQPYAFMDPTPVVLSDGSAGTYMLPPILPITTNLKPPFAPTANIGQGWLTVSGATNGVVSFHVTQNNTPNSRIAKINLLGMLITVTQPNFGPPGNPPVPASAPVEGPWAGSDSIVLAELGAWTNSTSAAWLHLDTTSQSGVGNATVVFGYDANPGPTRTGLLSINGAAFTVTQAGSNYVLAQPLTTIESDTNYPTGLTLDEAGHVYYTEIYDNYYQGRFYSLLGNLEEWTPANNTIIPLMYDLYPIGDSIVQNGLAQDGDGNVYISGSFQLYGGGVFSAAVWSSFDESLTPFDSYLPGNASAVALDNVNDVFLAFNGLYEPAIVDLSATNLVSGPGNLPTLDPLIAGEVAPSGLAFDAAGNMYFSDDNIYTVWKWSPETTNLVALVDNNLSGTVSGIKQPAAIAVDNAGNVFIADAGDSAIKVWTAATATLSTLPCPGLNDPLGLAVDASDNVYIADTFNNAIKELPRVFVSPAVLNESAASGGDVLPSVLPANANLLAPFAPTSDQPWLTITSINNGVVGFSFTANRSPLIRVAIITLLGVINTITQYPVPNLNGMQLPGTSNFQITFTNNPSATFTVLTATNLAEPPANWTVAGVATNMGSGVFQFVAPTASATEQQYYRVTSP